MAGIGFTLRSLIGTNRYITDLKANIYSLIISSGPWVFAILCIAGLSFFCIPVLPNSDILLFRTMITYIYAFSLVTSSFIQLVLIRFISDRLYQREYSSLLPNLLGSFCICGIVNFTVAIIFMYYSKIIFLQKIIFIALFCIIGFQWAASIFLSLLRDYIKITAIYFIGYIVSFLMSLLMGYYFGLTGFFTGFATGQVLILIFLLQRISEEFQLGKNSIFEFTGYFKKYPELLFSAALYNFGFWIDKVLMWYSPGGAVIVDLFRMCYIYDTASYVSVLSILPSISLFFLIFETSFYEELRKYIYVILNRGNYEEIESRRANLKNVLKSRLAEIVEIQLVITLIFAFLSPRVAQFFNVPAAQFIPIFIISLFAAFFQVLFLMVIILLWYLEIKTAPFLFICLFAFLNFILNYFAIYYTYLTPGWAYLVSISFTFFVALSSLVKYIEKLNYTTLFKGPIPEGQIEMPKFN